ncbi:MAG: hypothetical protein ACSLE0_22255 [Chitinophagaceae bacterium]
MREIDKYWYKEHVVNLIVTHKCSFRCLDTLISLGCFQPQKVKGEKDRVFKFVLSYKKRPCTFEYYTIMDVVRKLNSRAWTCFYNKPELMLLPKTKKDLCIGDTFSNTQGYLTTVVGFFSSGNSVKLESITGTKWFDDTQNVIARLHNNHYTNFKRTNKTIKTIEKDDTQRTIEPNNGTKELKTAIKSYSPRKIAIASQLVGNPIANRIKRGRVGEFKICQISILC